MDADTKIARTESIVASSINDELVMFDADAGQYYSLNPVAAQVWQHLETPKTIADLCALLTDSFDVTKEQCTEELISFLPDLEKKGLISVV